MPQKCYCVTFTIDQMVLADNEQEAKRIAQKHLDDYIDPDSHVRIANGLGEGWDMDDLVYHQGSKDITVREALEMNPEYIKQKERFEKFKRRT